jgi:hypothetical protein
VEPPRTWTEAGPLFHLPNRIQAKPPPSECQRDKDWNCEKSEARSGAKDPSSLTCVVITSYRFRTMLLSIPGNQIALGKPELKSVRVGVILVHGQCRCKTKILVVTKSGQDIKIEHRWRIRKAWVQAVELGSRKYNQAIGRDNYVCGSRETVPRWPNAVMAPPLPATIGFAKLS